MILLNQGNTQRCNIKVKHSKKVLVVLPKHSFYEPVPAKRVRTMVRVPKPVPQIVKVMGNTSKL